MSGQARGLVVLAVALAAVACRRDKDTYVVLHNDVNCDVPRVFQLRVTVTHGAHSDQMLLPAVAGAELGFPSSLVLDLPSPNQDALEVVVEAIDARNQAVGQGMAAFTIVQGGRVDVPVQIASTVAGASDSPTASGSAQLGGDGGSDGGGTADAISGGGSVFSQICAGALSTCAVRSDSSLWCWGDNDKGQLRLSSSDDRLSPAEVAGISWRQVACGQYHACAVRSDGTLACWGNNESGQLGVATAAFTSNQQTEVGDGPWQSVTAGEYQTCAIKADGSLWCWGDNSSGQVGSTAGARSAVPVQVAGTGWVQVSSNYLHTCAIKQDGTLWCWGLNADSQLGPGLTAASLVSVPEQVAGDAWVQVSTGLGHTCATKQDRSLWCWGGNQRGQLGNPSIAMVEGSVSGEPVAVSGEWLSVAAGEEHTCGVRSDGSLWCWGDDAQGQLGDGQSLPEGAPVAVGASGTRWQTVTAGSAHTCAVASDGTPWCWGGNSHGQLGIGSRESRQAPARVAQ